MYKIKEFFYKFFNPRGLISFRSISFFLALLIFIIEALILFFPTYNTLSRRPALYAKSNEYTKVYYEAEGEISEEMYNKGYRIVNGKMLSHDSELKIDKYSAKSNDINIYYIFDCNGYISNELTKIKTRYKELYNDEDDDKIQLSAILIYNNISSTNTLDDSITKYHNTTINDIETELSKLSYLDIYDIDDKDAYVMLFEKEQVYIEFIYEDKLYNNNLYYPGFKNLEGFKITDMKNMSDFSRCFINEFARGYALSASGVYLGNCLIYTILVPILLAFIFFIILRKRGNLKMFKEYYGILSITSILPCIIAFGLSWFITSTGGIVYLASTTIYGIIMLYAVSFLNLNKK